MEKTAKAVREQTNASWIAQDALARSAKLAECLAQQDQRLSAAMEPLNEALEFLREPAHILGAPAQKHGEAAEHMHVAIENARRLFDGQTPLCTFSGVGRTDTADFLRGGVPMQCKFVKGADGQGAIRAIKQHLADHPDFLQRGGQYVIPRDQYDYICQLLKKPLSQLSPGEQRRVENLHAFEQQHHIHFQTHVRPAAISYDSAQLEVATKKISGVKADLRAKDRRIRSKAYAAAKPTLKQGAQTAGIGAALEGGVAALSAFHSKVQDGTALTDLTGEDWKDVGQEGLKGAVQGTLRGAGTYAAVNLLAAPASVVAGAFSMGFSVVDHAISLKKGELTGAEFVENCGLSLLDSGCSTACAAVGQLLCPIPVLGAVGGSILGQVGAAAVKHLLRKA